MWRRSRAAINCDRSGDVWSVSPKRVRAAGFINRTRPLMSTMVTPSCKLSRSALKCATSPVASTSCSSARKPARSRRWFASRKSSLVARSRASSNSVVSSTRTSSPSGRSCVPNNGAALYARVGILISPSGAGLAWCWKRRLLASAQHAIEQFDGAVGTGDGQRLFERLADDRLSGCTDQAAKGRIHPTHEVLFTLGRGRGERQMLSDQTTERREVDGNPLRCRGSTW